MGKPAQYAWIIRVFAILIGAMSPAFADAAATAQGVALNASAGLQQRRPRHHARRPSGPTAKDGARRTCRARRSPRAKALRASRTSAARASASSSRFRRRSRPAPRSPPMPTSARRRRPPPTRPSSSSFINARRARCCSPATGRTERARRPRSRRSRCLAPGSRRKAPLPWCSPRCSSRALAHASVLSSPALGRPRRLPASRE